MKMLIVTDAWHPQINGVVRTYEYMIPELEKRGHEVKVIGPSDFRFHMPMPGYKEIELTLLAKRKLSRMIDEFAPDSIHIATEGPLGFAARSHCRKKDLPFNTAYHTQFPQYIAMRIEKALGTVFGVKHLPESITKPLRKIFSAAANISEKAAIRWIRNFHNPSSAVMVATPSLQDELTGWGFKAPMRILTRGVMTDIFNVTGPKALQHLPKPIAINVGRVAIEKNLEEFLNMKWEGSKVVVGSGPSLGYLKEKYPDAHFTGAKTGKELGDHIRGADVFIFPSKSDTFGMVNPEALACGLPIVTFNRPPGSDIVTSPMLGVLTDNNLGEAAKRALKAPGTREDRYRHVLENYTWPIVAKQYEQVSEETRIRKPAP